MGALCEFLGKEVPEVPFPRLNQTAVQRARIRQRPQDFLIKLVGRLIPWTVGLTSVAVGA